jgi:hypothetical protein
MAGQLIAEHLLETQDIQAWLNEAANAAKLDPNNREERHTLASDMLAALVDLFPLCLCSKLLHDCRGSNRAHCSAN